MERGRVPWASRQGIDPLRCFRDTSRACVTVPDRARAATATRAIFGSRVSRAECFAVKSRFRSAASSTGNQMRCHTGASRICARSCGRRGRLPFEFENRSLAIASMTSRVVRRPSLGLRCLQSDRWHRATILDRALAGQKCRSFFDRRSTKCGPRKLGIARKGLDRRLASVTSLAHVLQMRRRCLRTRMPRGSKQASACTISIVISGGNARIASSAVSRSFVIRPV